MKHLIVIFIVVLLAGCGSQPTNAPTDPTLQKFIIFEDNECGLATGQYFSTAGDTITFYQDFMKNPVTGFLEAKGCASTSVGSISASGTSSINLGTKVFSVRRIDSYLELSIK